MANTKFLKPASFTTDSEIERTQYFTVLNVLNITAETKPQSVFVTLLNYTKQISLI